jgi:hypothetical protein
VFRASITVDEGEFLHHGADRLDRLLNHGMRDVDKRDMRPEMLSWLQANSSQRDAKPLMQRYGWNDQSLSRRSGGDCIERYFKRRKRDVFSRPFRREDRAFGQMPMITEVMQRDVQKAAPSRLSDDMVLLADLMPPKSRGPEIDQFYRRSVSVGSEMP